MTLEEARSVLFSGFETVYDRPQYTPGYSQKGDRVIGVCVLYGDGSPEGKPCRVVEMRFDPDKGATAEELTRLRDLVDAANRGLEVGDVPTVVEGGAK